MMWDYNTPGIPDELFDRADKVPITKEEVRAIQISKARLKPDYTIYDIGCGSGSVTVEAALQAESGRVVGIDNDQRAIQLSEKNVKKFNLSNVSLMLGDAKDKIKGMGQADAIFIGGTGGDTTEIIELCRTKLKPGRRIVIGTILIETLHAVLELLGRLEFKDIDITQVTISKSKKTSTGTMMLARNPVTVISATSNFN